jgi:hypothetical protein
MIGILFNLFSLHDEYYEVAFRIVENVQEYSVYGLASMKPSSY